MPDSGEIEIEGRTYGLVERVEGQHYEATLQKDKDTVYTVHCHHGLWTCKCPAMKFRKRDDPPCKHIRTLRSRHQEKATMPATAETTTPDAVRDARGLTNTRPAPQQVIPAPAQQPVSVPTSQPGRVQLYIALARAQSAVGRISHDGEVAFGNVKYPYTSSEAIIEAAKKALGDNGLALLPLEETLNGHEREGADRFELECKFVLLHQSGEAQPLLRHWPVCIDKGRALDKATAAASTLCLAYLLRDLLLIPRVNPVDEVAARDDQPVPARTRPPRAEKPAPQMPKDGAELEARLKTREAKMVAEGLCAAGDLLTAVRSAGVQAGYVPDLVRWPAAAMSLASEEAKKFVAKCKAGKGPVHAG